METVSALSLPLPSVLSGPALASAHRKPGDARSLDAIATNFESMFLSLLLKELRQALEPDGLFAGDKADIHGGLFDFFLGQHLAQAGGFGLARLLKRQLEQARPHEPSHATLRSTG